MPMILASSEGEAHRTLGTDSLSSKKHTLSIVTVGLGPLMLKPVSGTSSSNVDHSASAPA